MNFSVRVMNNKRFLVVVHLGKTVRDSSLVSSISTALDGAKAERESRSMHASSGYLTITCTANEVHIRESLGFVEAQFGVGAFDLYEFRVK